MSTGIQVSAHVEQRLRNEPIGWISTVRPDGRPHLVPIWFLWNGSTILIFSKPDQKIRNLKANPRIVFSLNANDDGEDIVIIEGTVTISEGQISAELEEYAQKYAELLPRINSTAAQMATQYTQAIQITPTKLTAWGGE